MSAGKFGLLGALAVLTVSSSSALAGGGNAGGALWVRGDNGVGWSGRCVSLGAQGTQVFTEIEFGQDHAELISGFSPDPAVPVWQNAVPTETSYSFVDSAEFADVHVSIHQLVLNNNQSTKQTVVSKYRSTSSTPDWTYTFPGTTSGNARAAVSDDGQRILAASYENSTNKLRIALFGATSGTPTWTGTIDNFSMGIRGFDVSSDGTLLYVCSAATLTLWDTVSHTSVAQYAVSSSVEGAHSMSGDGRVFALGGFNFVDVWEKNAAGGYSKTFTRNLPGSYVCTRVDVCGNGSKIAMTFNGYDTNNHVRVECLDVATKTITMSDEAVGTGTLQNVAGDVSMSYDGSRFVVGLWGDEGNVCPEVRFYRSNQNAPVALHNLSGSVFDVDISADGERVGVAAKAVHANQFASGGSIRYYAFEEQDLRMTGVPRPGAEIDFLMTSAYANSPSRLLWAPSLAATPAVFGSIGTLYLNRPSMHTAFAPTTDGTGASAPVFTIPTSATVGSTLYFQGLFTTPRRLTNDWVRVTVLP